MKQDQPFISWEEFKRERGIAEPQLNHSMLSPSGRASGSARRSALARHSSEFRPFFAAVEEYNKLRRAHDAKQPSAIMARVAQIREFAAMAGPRQSKKLLAEAAALEATVF